MSQNQQWARYYFSVLGLVLWFLPGFILRKVLPAHDWAERLYPGDARAQARFLLPILVGMLIVGALCQVTAWGLKRNRSWARWTGIAACAGLLAGIPWLTLVGVVGIVLLLSVPAPLAVVTVDKSRLRRRESVLDWIVGSATGVLLLAGMVLLFKVAHGLGLPKIRMGREFWPILVGGELLVVTLHEFGHAIAAWAVHFRFKVINIGPVTVWKDALGARHWKFEWARLCCGGGYTGAVPTSDKGLRMNQILVVFAGPFVSLNAGLALFLLFLKIPGTVWEGSWPIIGMFAVMFGVDFVRNLIPLGYTDGTLLLHLILWTAKGKEFSSAWLATKDSEEADRRKEEVDFDKEADLRRSVLEQALAHGEAASVELALKYQSLGFAEVRARRPLEAGQNLTKSLDILKQCGNVHPLVEANSWKGLEHAYTQLQQAADVRRAGSFAVRAFEKCKKTITQPGALEVQSALAQLHINANHYEAALDEIQQGLESVPQDRKYLLLKAKFFRLRAECEFLLGCSESGLEAAETAAQILRSAEIAESDRAHAWRDLGVLAASLWMAGRTEPAIALFNQAIQFFELQASIRGDRLRLALAQVLRRDGRLVEAEAALPVEERIKPEMRENFLTQRSQIWLRLGRVEQSIADLGEALQLKKADSHASTSEIATAESLLAEALLEGRRVEEAEASARSACGVLVPAEHPNAAGGLVTLALIARERGQESADAYLDEGLRLLSEAPLLKPAAKAHFFESEAARLERHGWKKPAEDWRSAAARNWESLGLEVQAEPVVGEPSFSRM